MIDLPDRPTTIRTPLRSSRALAVFLSFLLPGTGQLLTGRIRAGLFFLLPFLSVIVIALVAAGGDRGQLLGYLVQPSVLLGIAAFDIVILAWRIAAILDAWRGGTSAVGRTSMVVVLALLAITGGTHYLIGLQVLMTRDTIVAVFTTPDDTGDDGFGDIAVPTETPDPTPTLEPGATPGPTSALAPTSAPTPKPAPTPRPGPLTDGRLDILLVGADSGPGRWSLRTDTLIVMSVDVKSGEIALFSIPRNMLNVPLPAESRNAFACGCFPDLINGLYVYASGHPGQFPGNDDTRGLRAVQMAIDTLTGLKLDGMVVVQLQGFVRLVDAIGGLDINVPEAVYDQRYPLENGGGDVTVSISPGKQHMAGHRALMYARSRHQDSDYGRMERQQLVISALGKQLLKEPIFFRLPELLDIARKNLWTNLKTRDLPDLAGLAEWVDIKGMKTFLFVPPSYPSDLGGASIKHIRAVVAHAFDDAVPLVGPAPTPTPLPTPTPEGY